MLSREMPPASQILGKSQRASARPVWPTDSLNQTEGPNSPRSRGARGSDGGSASESTSGAERPSRQRRTKAAATCSALKRDRICCAISASSPTPAARAEWSRRRMSSLACTSSALGALPHSATTLAPCNRRWALRTSDGATISAETPFLPARPVRPERCRSVSEFVGRSA